MPAKPEIITFKADASLIKAMEGVHNRSEFIRNALLSALKHVCPLCKGAGILTPDQRRHWDAFEAKHPLEKCGDCDAMHPVCSEGDPDVHSG